MINRNLIQNHCQALLLLRFTSRSDIECNRIRIYRLSNENSILLSNLRESYINNILLDSKTHIHKTERKKETEKKKTRI